jgi:hypothetical protein
MDGGVVGLGSIERRYVLEEERQTFVALRSRTRLSVAEV